MNLKAAIKKVFNKIASMSDKEFKEALKEHQDGDIARIMLESGALEQMDIDTLKKNNQ
jgi:ketosteroid isomerase-like protein